MQEDFGRQKQAMKNFEMLLQNEINKAVGKAFSAYKKSEDANNPYKQLDEMRFLLS